MVTKEDIEKLKDTLANPDNFDSVDVLFDLAERLLAERDAYRELAYMHATNSTDDVVFDLPGGIKDIAAEARRILEEGKNK